MKEDVLFTLVHTSCTPSGYLFLKLRRADGKALPEIEPGQFAEVEVPRAAGVLLRRPISIHYVQAEQKEIWLMVREVGRGTRALGDLKIGDTLRAVLPLGQGFRTDLPAGAHVVLVGGGVGAAPLLDYARVLSAKGVRVSFVVGARTASELQPTEAYAAHGEVYLMTDDGSFGTPGRVTEHPLFASDETIDAIAACGPRPMLRAVAEMALERGIPCEVSLENRMACGIGACLCCVETMADGHNTCVCTEGPVFDAQRWLNKA